MAANKDSTATIGRVIYNEQILPLMRVGDKGKVVVIDVE